MKYNEWLALQIDNCWKLLAKYAYNVECAAADAARHALDRDGAGLNEALDDLLETARRVQTLRERLHNMTQSHAALLRLGAADPGPDAVRRIAEDKKRLLDGNDPEVTK